MKKHSVILMILILPLFGFGQSIIETKKPGVYTQNGRILRVNEMVNLMENSPEALEIMLQAKSTYNTAMALGYIGGFMIGWPIGTAIGGGKPNWVMAAIGAPIAIIGFTLNPKYKRQSAKAVELHNGSSSTRAKPELEFGAGKYGLSLKLKF